LTALHARRERAGALSGGRGYRDGRNRVDPTQAENTKPPRALWVPFELGRPFGPPSDPAFQKRVILAALRLLESERGPVVIEDFADDDPRAGPDPAWRRPLLPSAAGEGSPD
jgi:hypothetical protein